MSIFFRFAQPLHWTGQVVDWDSVCYARTHALQPPFATIRPPAPLVAYNDLFLSFRRLLFALFLRDSSFYACAFVL